MNKIFRTAYIIIIGMIVLGTACKHEKKGYVKAKRKPKPAPVITTNPDRKLDSASFSKDDDNDFVIDPMTIGPIALYGQPDTLTPVKEILPAFTPFKRLGYITIDCEVRKPGLRPGDPPYTQFTSLTWYRILTDDGREGYLHYVGENIAKYTFTDTVHHVKYMVGTYLADKKTHDWKMGFFKFDMANQKITDKISCELLGESQEKIAAMKRLPLSNVQFAINFSQHADFCGGGELYEIIVDTPTGLTKLPECRNTFDDGDYSAFNVDAVYLPIADNNGHVALYSNDSVIQLTDTTRFKPDTFAYPANATVPINNVIVRTTELGEIYVDKDGDPITLKNGENKYKTHSKVITYYHWDGQKATIAYKQTTQLALN
jgi:hypothetical protein